MTKPRYLELDPENHNQTWQTVRYQVTKDMMSHVLQHTVWQIDDGGFRMLFEAIPRRGVNYE